MPEVEQNKQDLVDIDTSGPGAEIEIEEPTVRPVVEEKEAEDKTYENETQESIQLKNIIDMKEAQITTYQSTQTALYEEVKKLKKENDELRLFKIKAVEEAKKEADSLMVNKCLKYEDEIKEVKEDNKKLAKQIEDLKKEAKDMLLYP